MGTTAHLAAILKATWGTPGVSEFLSAALGGALTLAAQWIAIRHERKKDDALRRESQKGTAWAIYFKIGEVHEAFTPVWQELQEARRIADGSNRQLWQVWRPAVQDLRTVQWETGELVLLLDHRQFDLMQRYQMATKWLSNLAQAHRTFREMRLDFLTTVPSRMDGQQGSFEVTEANERELMPRIAHLGSLADSVEKVVNAQRPDIHQLLQDYAAAMKGMIGTGPVIEFRDEKSRA